MSLPLSFISTLTPITAVSAAAPPAQDAIKPVHTDEPQVTNVAVSPPLKIVVMHKTCWIH